jgi:hypothetical protein
VTAVTGLLGEKSRSEGRETLTLDISLAALGRPIRAVWQPRRVGKPYLNPVGGGQPDVEPDFFQPAGTARDSPRDPHARNQS